MKQVAIAAAIAALASATSFALPIPSPTCCACITGGLIPTSQVNRTLADVLFCAAAPDGNTTALQSRCVALGGGDPITLVCTDVWSNATCREELAQAGFVCPNAGVPAAGPLNLATLAVVLSAARAVALRRRSRRDA